MAIASLTAQLKAVFSWTASNNITGSDYGQITNATTLTKTLNVGTSAANAAAGGGDLLYSLVTSLAFGASASLDLTALTDILGSAANFARIKGIMIRPLSATDDTTIGTAATPLLIDNTVTNALSSQASSGWFANAAEGAANGSRFHIPTGGFLAFGVPSAGGIITDGTHKIIKLTNSDGALTMKIQVTIVGGSS